MKLKVMWLTVSFALLICILALPTGNYDKNTSVFSLLVSQFDEPEMNGKDPVDIRWVVPVAVAIFCLGIGGLYFGMQCLLGKTEMKTGWALAVGLPCTTFGLGVFLFVGLFLLGFCILVISGGPSM